MVFAVFQKSLSLQKKAKILQDLVDCPEIVHYFGNDLSVESGVGFYNLQLEYASGGTLEDLIKKTGGKLVEYDVQRLRTLRPEARNILVFRSKDGRGIVVKIADFGILKILREENDFVKRKLCFRGTPIYMSPESVALGLVMFQIVFGKEPPKIPETMSEHGKDFLGKCFVRDPRKRWTAEMLLNQPFVIETECLTSTKIRLDCSFINFKGTVFLRNIASSSWILCFSFNAAWACPLLW
ncbi:mitogen-activated protein kinase kinase kinase 18-like [Quercus lobata]|uniref:mitogen-activated protein kinase kinase kinase 18-like n=1 Tax=Quercus lobata TaxID=97700 RepID=UPI001243FAB5|nr:mitogen-activated protein kinase kinase kinase 18-like [Quercus lobata]